MLAPFLRYIAQNALFEPTDRLLVAVSGGKDSMVLLHLLQQGGFRCEVAHANFQLRGDASDSDEVFVQTYCQAAHIPFHINRFDTKKTAEQQRISIQMAARQLRYDWFEALRQQHGFTHLLTAHHLSDSLETTLLNLTKGTGIVGLTGIAKQRNWLVRPLLFATRQEIDLYAEQQHIIWREDASNESVVYQRNFIRHEVLPLLRQINPSLEATFGQSLHRLAAAEAAFQQQLTQFKQAAITVDAWGNWMIDEPALKPFKAFAGVYLEALLRPKGFNLEAIESILEPTCLNGKFVESEAYYLVKERNGWELLLKEKLQPFAATVQQMPASVALPSLQTLIAQLANFPARQELIQKNKCFLDASKVIWPLQVRSPQPADWFIPFGMKGRKKLSDYFADHKFSMRAKRQQLVVAGANKQIYWLVGERTDARVALTKDTTEVLKLEIL